MDPLLDLLLDDLVDVDLARERNAAADKETAEIRERRGSYTGPHKFKAAKWTHPNGHPRCALCGDEEPIGGKCPGYGADLSHDVSHELRDRNGQWTETPLDREVNYVVGQLETMVRADKGPDRRLMPQLSGVPLPGSKADKIPHAPGQEVDLTDQFEKELRAQGVDVNDTVIPSSMLKPTQDQLVAAKVKGIAKYMETAAADDRVYEPIFVTKDDYVIDGHHRWAGNVVLDRLDGTDQPMRVRQVGLDREAALAAATKFMDEWGLPRAGMTHAGPAISTFARPPSA